MSVKNVMFVGVGGQGTLLASRLLGHVMIKAGYDVKVSEVHGMSQRGGSVVTYVRYGEKVHSPIVSKGGADMIVAFEKLEAARYISFLKKDGIMIVNTQRIDPISVITGAFSYPENIEESLGSTGADVFFYDAVTPAVSCGSAKAVNIVLLGIMAKKMGLKKEDFLASIDELVAEKFRDMNKKAFLTGFDELA